MELRCSPSLVIVWSVGLLFYGVQCQTQEVLFNLKDPESNEVISLGQENVALVCHVTNTLSADIMITDAAGADIASNLGNGNCLEHTIALLTEADNGNYMCHVRYFDKVREKTETIIKSLLLNVESGDQQCFRNGTSKQAFGVGDTLQLSCYCTSTINCNWVRTVVGTQKGVSIPVYETVEFDNKKRIIRVIIGPVTTDQINERYDCYYGSQAEERCSLGPTYVSTKDFVLNAVDPSNILRECPKPATSDPDTTNAVTSGIPGTSQGTEQGTVIPTTEVTEPPAEKGLFLYSIIAGPVVLVLILVVILLIFITLKKKRKVTAKEQGREESFKASSNSNPTFDDSADGPDRGTLADINSNDVLTASLTNEYASNRAPPPDGIGYSDGSQIGDMSHYGVPNAVLVNSGENHRDTPNGDVYYASVNPKVKTADVSQYGVLNAVVVGAGDDAEEGFYCGEVTEYGVPVAFRADDHSDVNRRGIREPI